MEDVLEVYHRPYDPKRPVVNLDEISKTLHDTPQGTLPMEPGQVARQDYQFTRNGSINLFLKVEPLRGWRKVRVTDRRTSLDFAEELRSLVDEDYPEAEVVVLITDNLNTHSPACPDEVSMESQVGNLAVFFDLDTNRHFLILQAIKDRSADGAEELMRQHIQHFQDTIRSVL